jgi:hypothetical protein
MREELFGLSNAKGRIGSMRRNLGILVGLIVFGMGSNSYADIVGLQSAPASPTSSVRFNNNSTIVKYNFTTTSKTGSKWTGFNFAGLKNIDGTQWNGTISFLLTIASTGATVADTMRAYSGTKVDFTNVDMMYTYNMAANTEYNLQIRAYGNSGLMTLSSGTTLVNNMSDYITGATQTANNGSNYGASFDLYTAVPEPGTLILTSSALVAGAIGAYFKRRRRHCAEVAA